MYIYISYLNSFLIDSRAEIRAGARVGLKFTLEKLEIVKSDTLKALLSMW